MQTALSPAGPSLSLRVLADDGYAIQCHVWRQAGDMPAVRPVVIVNPATSVRCHYYFRFVDYLHAHGYDVIAYDYRGIGGSRPSSLRGFRASWTDWGALDFQAVLAYASRAFPRQPIDVVAHSFGGCAIGLAASAATIRRVVTVGAQFAYWRDYDRATRGRMFVKWHVAMPLLAACWGYLPAKRLGWMEDTPRGVAADWGARSARYEDRPSGRQALRAGALSFDRVQAPILAISLTDDPFGTVAAIERLLSYFTGSGKTHLRIAPADIGASGVGHFAFFHSRHADTLWPIALQWLRHGALAAGTPGTITGNS
jgi:predicted alpha/beta hydrolase